jgi:hypothetical protein
VFLELFAREVADALVTSDVELFFTADPLAPEALVVGLLRPAVLDVLDRQREAVDVRLGDVGIDRERRGASFFST